MNRRFWIVLPWLCAGVLIAHPAASWAADPDPDRDLARAAKAIDDTARTTAGQQQVAGRVAQELNTSCHCTTFSAASVSAQHAQTGWGWGEVLIADSLALALSQKTGMSFNAALGQITSARQQGTGWGAIAKAHDLKVGPVVSDVQKSAKAVETSAKLGDKTQDKATKAADKTADRAAKASGKAEGSGIAGGTGGGDKGADKSGSGDKGGGGDKGGDHGGDKGGGKR
jgi:hypothetical protein